MLDAGESPLWLTKVRPFLADLASAFNAEPDADTDEDLASAFNTDPDAATDEDHRQRSVRIDFDQFGY